MSSFLILFSVLAVATIYDLLYRRIPDWLTIPTILGFTTFWLLSGDFRTVFHPVSAFLFSYILYRLGVWAGGDVKLFTAIAAVYPFSCTFLSFNFPFFFAVFLASLFISFLAALCYTFFKVFSDHSVRSALLSPLALSARKSLVIALSAHVFGIVSVLLTFFPFPYDLLASLAVFATFPSISAVKTFFLLFSASLLFILLAIRHNVFVREKGIGYIFPGDIPADFVTAEGEIIPFSWKTAVLAETGRLEVKINPLRAKGLDQEDIEFLRRIGVSKIRVKISLPFVPFVLLAAIFILLCPYFSCG